MVCSGYIVYQVLSLKALLFEQDEDWKAKDSAGCLHSEEYLSPLHPVEAEGDFLLFWFRDTLHLPWLPVFLTLT